MDEGASARIVPLGEKLLATLRDHIVDHPGHSGVADALSALGMAWGELLGDLVATPQQAVNGCEIAANSIFEHALARIMERAKVTRQ